MNLFIKNYSTYTNNRMFFYILKHYCCHCLQSNSHYVTQTWSLCHPGWPPTCCVSPVSVSSMQRLYARAFMPSFRLLWGIILNGLSNKANKDACLMLQIWWYVNKFIWKRYCAVLFLWHCKWQNIETAWPIQRVEMTEQMKHKEF